MKTSQAEFTATGGAQSQTARFITCLMEAQGAFVPMPLLAEVMGGFACHSRASDARRMGYNIENYQERDPITGKRLSFYRIVP